MIKAITKQCFYNLIVIFQTLNKKWFDPLKNPKGDMLPSPDGVGKTAEYVPYPCDWNKVNANIKTFIAECGETWTVKCMPTVSIVSPHLD